MTDDRYGADDDHPPRDDNFAADDPILDDPLADLMEDTPEADTGLSDGELPAEPPPALSGPALDKVSSAISRHEHRLRALDEAIAVYPDEPANYVLRGEVYLKMRNPDLAALDFEKALEIAREAVTTRRWGLVNQVVVDRAQRGLRHAERDLLQGKRKRRVTGGL